MKAARVTRFGLEHPMELEEVAEPKPGPGEMLVRIAAAGVNPLEVAIRSGNHPRAGAMTLPYTCGTDVAGEVEAIGDGVEAVAPGEPVGPRLTGRMPKGLLPQTRRASFRFDLLCGGAALPIPTPLLLERLVGKEAARAIACLCKGPCVGYSLPASRR